MARLIFGLSAEERERLEQHRAKLGKRSLAEVIRYWISADPLVCAETSGSIFPHFQVKAPMPANTKPPRDSVATLVAPPGPSAMRPEGVQFGPIKGARLKSDKGKS